MKSINEMINEAAQVQYRVALLDVKDSEDLPINVIISVDKSNVKEFEDWLNNEEGNTFAHAEGGNVEY